MNAPNRSRSGGARWAVAVVVVVRAMAVAQVVVADGVAISAVRPHRPASRVAMRRHALAAPRHAPRKRLPAAVVRKARAATRGVAMAVAVAPSALP